MADKEMFGFVMVQAPNGRRMLLNLDMTLALIETETNTTEAVSIAGIKTPLGTPLDEFINALLAPA